MKRCLSNSINFNNIDSKRFKKTLTIKLTRSISSSKTNKLIKNKLCEGSSMGVTINIPNG